MLDEHTLLASQNRKMSVVSESHSKWKSHAVTQRTRRPKIPTETASPKLCPFSGPQIWPPRRVHRQLVDPPGGPDSRTIFQPLTLRSTPMGTRGIPAACATQEQRLPNSACGSEFRRYRRAQHRYGYTNPPSRRRVKGRARGPTAVRHSSVASYYSRQGLTEQPQRLTCTL